MGGRTPSGTTRDRHLGQKKPFEQKKTSAFAALRLLEGPGEARHYQGPPGIDTWVKRNRLSQKKISAFAAFVAIRGRWRVPGRPDTVRDHQGPPGIDAWVKRNRLSQKKNFGLCGLEAAGGSRGGPTLSGTTRDRRLGQKEPFEQKKNFGLCGLCGHWRPLEGPGEDRHYQGPPGIDAWVKRNRLSKKKISAFAAFVTIGGRWRVPGKPDTIRDHQGSTLGSKGTV